MPPVTEVRDEPFRAKMKGKSDTPDESGEYPEAPGLTGMKTGPEAYEQQFGRPAREAVSGVPGLPDVPAQEAVKGSIDTAKDAVAQAEADLAAAKDRQSKIAVSSPKAGGSLQQQKLLIDDEVDRATKRLDNARSALGAESRRGIETEGSARVFGGAAATAVGQMVPDIIGGAARPFDEALDKAGLPRGTGVADYMKKASTDIANANLSDPQQQDSLSAKYGSGVGSMAGFAITGVAGKLAGLPQWAVSGGTGALQNAEQFYRDADAMGATGMQKALSYLSGGVIGSTEALGSGRVLDQLDHVTGGGVKRYLGALLKSGSEEGFQEGLQQLLENMSKYGILGKDPGDITSEVGTNALIGAVLGMGMAGLAHLPGLVSGRGAIKSGEGVPIPNQEVVTPEQVAAQVAQGGIQVAPPIPTGQPVTTTEGGVNTTTTVHGPAEAYTPTVDPVTQEPSLKPTIDPAAFADEVAVKAGELYSDNIDHAQAFTNGAHNSIWNTGLPEGTELTPEIHEAYNAGQDYWHDTNSAETGISVDPAARESTPVQGMYSRLRQWVAEKGPGRLPASEWLAKLTGNNAFTKEEVNDLQLPQYLANLGGGRATLTKQELLDQIDLMTAPMVEVTRTPLTQAQKTEQTAALQQQIMGVMAADPTAHAPEGGPNVNHPIVGPLIDRLVNLDKASEWAQYQQYTTPGPRTSYTELTMHLPSRGQMVRVPSIDGWESESGEELYTNADFVGGHYSTPNEIVTIRLTERETVDGQRVLVLEEVQRDATKAEKAGEDLGLPHKDNYTTLGVTRALMWAAQKGITRVVWANSDEQMRRYPSATRAGMEHFYDRVIPSVMKKWARNLGGTISTTMIPDTQYEVRPTRQFVDPMTQLVTQEWGVVSPQNQVIMTTTDKVYAQEYAQRNTSNSLLPSMELPQSAIDTINNKGVPTYAREAGESLTEGVHLSKESSATPMQVYAASPLLDALNSLMKRMKLGVHVRVVLHEGTIKFTAPGANGKMESHTSNSLGLMVPHKMKAPKVLEVAEIHISVGQHTNAAQVWATMVHELGHVIMYSIWHGASAHVKTAVKAAWEAYKLKAGKPGTTMAQVIQLQSNAVPVATGFMQDDTTTIDSLSPGRQDYWLGFDEFFAEHVAKWATTSEKPLSVVDKFFAGIAKTILNYLREASAKFGMQFEPVPELTAFLDSFLEADLKLGPQIDLDNTQYTTVKNNTQMLPEETAVEAQTETAGAAGGINGAFDGRPPKEAQEAKAYADKFSKLRKYFYAIHHLATANPHIQALQDYVEVVRIAKLTKDAIMIRTQDVLRKWSALGGKQADAVSQLLDNVQNMTYLTPDEVKKGISRHPTLAELQLMAKQYGVTQAGLAVFAEVGKSFQEMLQRVEAVLRADANKIADPTRQALQHAKIDRQMANYRSKPYFPGMRFGEFSITVRNAAGKVIHFETFETKRRRDRAMAVVQSKLAPGDVPQAGFVDKQVKPLLGVPGPILELMAEKLMLSNTQRDALDQLKFELSPAQSFKHQFQHKNRIAGYSTDFQRVYANYFWHGANHLMKTMHADRLRALQQMAKTEAAGATDITKRQQIMAFMEDHTNAWLDPKGDHAWVSSLAFMWHLAFSPVAAAQNLTQVMLTTHPHLAAKFGDLSSVGAIGKAMRDYKTFLSKGKLATQTAFEEKALLQAIEDGAITGTQAPEIAGIADGNLLSKGWGGNQAQRFMTKFMEMGSKMFELAEQVNRRVTFSAALDLALKNPNAKYVRDSVKKRNLLYDKVRATMTEAQAAAYVAAFDSVLTTQFEYGKEASPRVLRGKARAFLVFQSFKLNYIVFLMQNPQAAVRSLIIMAALGGLMGVPGADDLKEILRTLGWQLFGRDFKLDREIRKFIIELLGKDHNGADIADLILHGASRLGFGIPAALNTIAGTAGIDFTMPTFDRSKSISLGTLLPVESSKLFGPPLQSTEKTIAEQGAKASGAMFGVGFAMYSALRDQQLSWKDARRWEKVMPRELASISKAYRAYSDEGMKSRSGSMRIQYDPRDNLGMAEIIGIGMGYTPYRQSLESEKLMSKLDAVKIWDIRHQALTRQFSAAALAKDSEEKSRVLSGIREFNKTLPPEAKGFAITTENLQASVESKAKSRAMEEKGLSTKTRDIPVMRAEDKLYPESQRTTRKVPRGLAP
jgi:hypothetical protein